MSKMAKAARAAMKKKAESMTAGDPHAKVDASSWTPPEMMNTEAKTGLRPISRRAYKKGGKVVAVSGKDVVHHAGKKARKAAGGEAAKYANAKVNRNVKEANAEIGKPHIGGYAGGGYAKGGRKGKMDGGMMGSGMMMGDPRLGVVNPKRLQFAQNLVTPGMKKGGHVDISADKKLIKKALRQHEVAEHGGKHVPLKLKKGGASCYADGGDVDADDVIKTPPTPSTNLPTQADIDRYNAMLAAKAEAEKARKESQSQSQKPAKAHGGSTERPFRYVGSQELKRSDLGLGMKRDESGKFENPVLSAARSADEPMQRKIPSASELKSKYQEFRSKKPFSPPEQSWRNKLVNKLRGDDKYARGGKTKGGMSMSEMGGNYTGGTRPTGGRIARATGGSAKKKAGKTKAGTGAGEAGRLDHLALVDGVGFANGTIELELAGEPAAGAAGGARGFVGVAFRVQPDRRTYDCIYLRPTNGRADDQELVAAPSAQEVPLAAMRLERIRRALDDEIADPMAEVVVGDLQPRDVDECREDRVTGALGDGLHGAQHLLQPGG